MSNPFIHISNNRLFYQLIGLTKSGFVLTLLALLNFELSAQNLVQNSDFENIVSCPNSLSQIDKAVSWSTPEGHSGTSDLLNSCNNLGASVPKNAYGSQDANSGNGYAGIYLYVKGNAGSGDSLNYREYLSTKLSETLVKGQVYTVSITYSLAEISRFYCNGLGIRFTNQKYVHPSSEDRDAPISLVPQISILSSTPSTDQWVSETFQYKASGGERYLIIGNFIKDQDLSLSTNSDTIPRPFDVSYMYIDDVDVFGCSEEEIDSLNIRFNLGNDTSLCYPDDISLIAPDSIDTYIWNTGSSAKSIEVAESGIYWLEAQKGKCIFRDSIQVTITDLRFSLGNDTFICPSQSLRLVPSNGSFEYTWNDLMVSATFQVLKPGTYWAKTSQNGCNYSDTILVTSEHVKADFAVDMPFGNQVCIKNLSEGADQYDWDLQVFEDITISHGKLDPNISTNNSEKICHTYTRETGCFFICLQAIGQRCRDTACKEVCVRSTPLIPNVFTPSRTMSGNGLNDTYHIQGLPESGFNFRIYNRWGEKIYEVTSGEVSWNGRIRNNGQLCPSGTYFYILEVPFKQYSGTITLLWE